MRSLGAQLRALREREGWSQTDLAGRVGVGKTAICHYESGDRYPRHAVLTKFAGLLKKPIGELYAETRRAHKAVA